MPTNWLGIDLPQITTQAQNVLNMERRGKTQDYMSREYQRREQSRPMMAAMLRGDEGASDAFRDSDPEGWLKGRSVLMQMESADRAAIKDAIGQAAVGLAAIEGAPPEQQQRRYQQFRRLQPASIQQIMPSEYSPEIGHQMLMQVRGVQGLIDDADRRAKHRDARDLATHKDALYRGRDAAKAALDGKSEAKRGTLTESNQLEKRGYRALSSRLAPSDVGIFNLDGDPEEIYRNNPELARAVQRQTTACINSTSSAIDAAACMDDWADSEGQELLQSMRDKASASAAPSTSAREKFESSYMSGVKAFGS